MCLNANPASAQQLQLTNLNQQLTDKAGMQTKNPELLPHSISSNFVYVGVIDFRNAANDGAIIGVRPDGTTEDLSIAVGGDSVIHETGAAGFLVADRRNSCILQLGMQGELISQHTLPPGEEIRDAILVSPNTVWITRTRTNNISVLDLTTGATTVGTDLSPVLENESIADPDMMLLHNGRVYIQLQRFDDQSPPLFFFPNGDIAVVDVATATIIDADPIIPGPQAIRLNGPVPRLKMHITPDELALIVSATGPRLDSNSLGGFERINLAALTSVGFIVEENFNFGALTPTTGDHGMGIFHTDIIESTHVFEFSTLTPAPLSPQLFDELFVIIEAIEYDPCSGLVLIPGRDGAMNEYDPLTGIRTRRIVFGGVPNAFIRDFAIPQVASCNPADLDGDGVVGSGDLAILLGSWGPCLPAPAKCIADLDGDGTVGSADLAILLGSWGS